MNEDRGGTRHEARGAGREGPATGSDTDDQRLRSRLRRRVLAATVGTGAALLAGCLGDGGAGDTRQGDGEGAEGDEEESESEDDLNVVEPESQAEYNDSGGNESGDDAGSDEESGDEEGGGASTPEVDWSEVEFLLSDPAENFEQVHEDTDTDTLQIATWNPFECLRPEYADGELDAGRFSRVGADSSPTVVYGPVDEPTGLRAEVHYNYYDGFGEVTFEYSIDGGESWLALEPDATVYNDESGDWDAEEPGAGYHNTLHLTRDLPDGITHVRLTLSGGDEEWTPQVGQVDLFRE